jgi:DNA-binding transcriptional ArsR family regulator
MAMEDSADHGKRKHERRKRCDPDEIDYVNRDMARALAHPMRIQILAELNKRAMSPSQFAKKFDLKTPNVSYHFRALQRLDCIEEVETRPVRGSVEHFYGATRRVLFDGTAWRDLPQSIKLQASGRAVSDFLEAVTAAMLAETFDSNDDRVLVWSQRCLDRQGWSEAVEAHWVLIHKMEDIYKDSRKRLLEAGEPEGGMVGTYGQFLFESPPPGPERPEGETSE